MHPELNKLHQCSEATADHYHPQYVYTTRIFQLRKTMHHEQTEDHVATCMSQFVKSDQAFPAQLCDDPASCQGQKSEDQSPGYGREKAGDVSPDGVCFQDAPDFKFGVFPISSQCRFLLGNAKIGYCGTNVTGSVN